MTYVSQSRSRAGENVGHIDFENGNGSLARITGTKEGAGASANDGILTFSTAFDTSLSEAMRIDSSGNVGIGTSSPSSRIHIQNDSDTDYTATNFCTAPSATISNTTSGALNYASLLFSTEANGEFAIGAVQNSGNTASDFVFASRTSGTRTERMRIDSSGNVKFGTVGTNVARIQPTAGNALLPTYSFDASADVGMYCPSTNNLGLVTGQVERMRIDSSGNVQIGTGTPAYLVSTSDIAQLSVNRVGTSGAITNASRSAAFINVNGANGGSSIEFSTASANNTQPTERMRIDASGNLLVGSSSSPQISAGSVARIQVIAESSGATAFSPSLPASATGTSIRSQSVTAAGTGWNHFVARS